LLQHYVVTKLQYVVNMSSFLKLFASSALAEILSFFLLNPDEEFYQSDIAKRTNKALMQVQRNLKRLEEIGLISSIYRGRMVYYKAIRTHPAFEDLKSMFLKTISFGTYLEEALEPSKDKIHLAWIYGSLAEGNEIATSDIDLFIIGNFTMREIAKIIGPVSRKLGREVNPVIMQLKEFKNKMGSGDHFLKKVIKKTKIWLIGNEEKLRHLAE